MAYRVKVAEQRVLKSAANELVEIQFSTFEIHWELFVKNDTVIEQSFEPQNGEFFRYRVRLWSLHVSDKHAPCQPFHGDLLSPVRVTSGLMVQHLRCRCMRLFTASVAKELRTV